ncbi:MAG: TlpA family protein disulfide reductase [Chloroflexi bacterium]|nr:TlpA family protein disulfide reductase [Chloroflexota bacterium]
MANRSERRKQIQQQKQKKTILGTLIGLGVIAFLAVAFSSLMKTASNLPQQTGITPAEVNYPAPELALESLAGRTESLADYRDMVVLVNNWATWCPPCKAEMPTLAAYYNAHAEEGFMIVAMEAGEPRDQVQAFADQLKLPFAVWLDPDGDSLKAFRNSSLPNSYVIDRSGTVRLMWTGEITKEALEKYVTPLLDEG